MVKKVFFPIIGKHKLTKNVKTMYAPIKANIRGNPLNRRKEEYPGEYGIIIAVVSSASQSTVCIKNAKDTGIASINNAKRKEYSLIFPTLNTIV